MRANDERGRVRRRYELYACAAPIFRRDGYRNATLKALAAACGLSIPALYRYFPSKKAFALFPLVPFDPALHAPPPPDGDPFRVLEEWVDAAVATLPHYTLALQLLPQIPVTAAERSRMESNLAAHVDLLATIARRAAPHLSERRARDLATTLVGVAGAPGASGLEAQPEALRRQLRTVLRGYGIALGPARR